MNVLKKKLNKSNGFTLVEMLIVVAIIAILVAVSIPLINSALEKSRDATDQANERSAKAEAVLLYMGVAVDSSGDEMSYDEDVTYSYNAVDGCLETAAGSTIAGYGKCTDITDGAVFAYGVADGLTDHKDCVLQLVSIDPDGKVVFQWVKGK